MRAPPSWSLPAAVALVVGAAVLLQLGRTESAARRRAGTSPEVPAQAGATAGENPKTEPEVALTPVPSLDKVPERPSPKPTVAHDGPPTGEELTEMWRSVILRQDSRQWGNMEGAVRRRWEDCRPYVLKLAGEDPNERVRAVNIRVLVVQKESTLVPFFAERLEKDTSPSVHKNCCWALGELNAKEYAPLVRRFLDSPDEEVKSKAKEALLKMGESP